MRAERLDRSARRGAGGPWSLVAAVAVGALLVLVVRVFLLEPLTVQGSSMLPNFVTGERILVARWAFWFSPPRDGEVVILRPPLTGQTSDDYIKRVVATAGQTVAMVNGRVEVDGRRRRHAYRVVHDHDTFAPMRVPPRRVFVLGDNRPVSLDSRIFGFVPYRNLRGVAFFVLWPLSRFGPVPWIR